MLIREFNSRFASQEDGSFLFQVMRKLSLLDPRAVLATDAAKWGEWPPDSDDPDSPQDPERGFAVPRFQAS